MAPLSVHLPQLPLAYCYHFLSLCNSHFFSARLVLLGLQWWSMW